MSFDLNQFNSFIFDFDGTLIDSRGDILECLGFAVRDHQLSQERLKNFRIGPPIQISVAMAFPELSSSQISEFIKTFRKYYNASSYPHTKVFEGSVDFLTKLQKQNKNLALATNKVKSSTLQILDRLQLRHFFSEIWCPDILGAELVTKTQMVQHILKNFNEVPKKTVLFGDSIFDQEAAKNAGLSFVFHENGYDTRAELLPQPLNHIFRNYSELVLSPH